MGNRRRNLALFAAVATVAIAAAAFAWSRSDPYRREMQPVYAVIKAGEQNWGSEATAMLHKVMARTSDRNALADRLLSESDGSLVAEGMVLAVQSRHPRARAILQEHLTDRRWNWAPANNDDLAKQLLSYLDQQKTEQWVLSWFGETANASYPTLHWTRPAELSSPFESWLVPGRPVNVSPFSITGEPVFANR